MKEYSSKTPRHIFRTYMGLGIFMVFSFILGSVMEITIYDSPSWILFLLTGITIIVTYFFDRYINRNVDKSKFRGDIEPCTACDEGKIVKYDNSGRYGEQVCSECFGECERKYRCIIKNCKWCSGYGGCWLGNKKVTCPCVLKNYEAHTDKTN